MKLSEWLRGPVPKNDPLIRALNVLVTIALLAVLLVGVLKK